ncbi:MAG: galactose-phosphate uridylyltransferase [Bacteroidota bacterium]|jgi:UDPglucose--hexose-1-phosphate uridylyltransferase
MAELRYNPLLDTWTMVASNRQNRPNLNSAQCPFCIGSGKVPDEYEVHIYQNDFPALSENPPIPDNLPESAIYKIAPSYGKCEVILFSPNHEASLSDLAIEHLIKLINVWAKRTDELANDPEIKYVFPFENRGEAVGVTMHHPHGQLYAYPFLPLKLKIELDNCKKHYTLTQRNLFADMIAEEKAFGKRVIFENDHFLAYLPFFTDYPFGLFIVNKNLTNFLPKLNFEEKRDLAEMLKVVTKAFDTLYDSRFPYMMCLHQAPCNMPEYADCADYYAFHIEFYPPLRAPNTVKYYASSETGAWAAANTRAVEETAAELRACLYS